MWYVIKEDELYHHGIKGQKWGVRRFQNPDGTLTAAGRKRITSSEFHAEQRKLTERYRKEDTRNQQIKSKRTEADELAKKYNFDLDDGGGGRTKADQKAGQKYYRLWEEIDTLEDEVNFSAGKRAAEKMAEKYGEKTVKSIKRKDTAKAVALIAPLLAIPVAVIAWGAKQTDWS